MEGFLYDGLPVRVIFGSGTVRAVSEEMERLNRRRALLITTPGRVGPAERLTSLLGDRAVGHFPGARVHTPVEVTDEALVEIQTARADCTIAIGGGSAIGLAKAIALRTGLPQIALPTTYSGSEMTTLIGELRDGAKKTQKDPVVLPRAVIYDVDLTVDLPARLTFFSGINAIAHGVEGLYARDASPLMLMAAEEGVRALSNALRSLLEAPADHQARSQALYGAWLCALCVGIGGVALHHKLCHVVGGAFDLPHAETHTVLLPHSFAYNASAAPNAVARLSRAIGEDDAVEGLFKLCRGFGEPLGLKDLGMPRDGIERAAALAVRDPYWNPRPLTLEGARELITAAWHGRSPAPA